MDKTLSKLLSICPGVTALIGGGGKTTAMYTLARELSKIGTVVCCTTTNIFIPQHMSLLTAPTKAELSATLLKHSCVCLGTPVGETGKLSAPNMPIKQLEALADYVLVEADGSKHLPVKAHLPHEPVIPPETKQTIVLVGASGFCQPVRDAVHRPQQFCQLAKVDLAAPLMPDAVAAVLKKEGFGDKVFVNQVETDQQMLFASSLAAALEVQVYAGALQKGIWISL